MTEDNRSMLPLIWGGKKKKMFLQYLMEYFIFKIQNIWYVEYSSAVLKKQLLVLKLQWSSHQYYPK